MDELRGEASNWSLGSDKRLLQVLQGISDNLLRRTGDLQHDLERLNVESRTTEVRMSNCLNSLLMLSNAQFIENVRTRLCVCSRGESAALVITAPCSI